ncbi:MAG: hypothetical protein VKM17_07900 [Cyanobacteriota bacterium]|nr:hypothetical protein [Cyanobacteriota bacterium]
MVSPFFWLPKSAWSPLFWASAGLALVLMVVLGRLSTDLGKNSILAFELAGSLTQSRSIVDGWREGQRLLAAFGLGLDYLFILSYVAAIGLGCLLTAQAWASLAPMGNCLAWAQVLAGVLDGIENWALLRVLLGSIAPGFPVLARQVALVKFVLVALGLLYGLVGSGLRLRRGI